MRIIKLVVMLSFLSGAAQAETLSAPPYPATVPWKMITDQHDAKMIWREWIPADQTEADIRDILTVQTFYIQKGRDPDDFLRDLFSRLRNACSGISINGPNARNEDGHAVSYGQVYCVGANGRDVDIFAKAIGGQDALYVVQREFRRPAEAGAVPSMRRFSKDEKDEALAAFAAQKVANDYLVSQVKLGPDDTLASSAPATTSPTATNPLPKHDDDVSASFGFEAGKTPKIRSRTNWAVL
jgi:hypothetical protein